MKKGKLTTSLESRQEALAIRKEFAANMRKVSMADRIRYHKLFLKKLRNQRALVSKN